VKIQLLKGSTDVTVYIFVQDSSSTVGAGLTGLVWNTASLVCYYVRPLAAATQLALATVAVAGAHTDGGFVEVSAANMPGVYRLDFSDAVCAAGVGSVVVMLKGATNMAPVLLEVQLTTFDLNSTAPDVNVLQISGDAAAANNAESFFDGTGYAGTNNVIPTVTTVGTVTTNSDLVTAAAVVNEWETQSQADPTGFHVNVLEVGGTAQTANDNGADINAILVDTGTTLPATLTTIEGKIDTVDTVADSVLEVLTSAGGSATSNGAADGTTIIDSAQVGANDLYNALAIKITSGLYDGQVRTIKDWDLGSTTFTLTRGFGGQIVTGVTYRVVSATVYQPGITLVPSSAATVEPDTLETISIAITTNGGAPTTGEITPGTITIARIRAGASTNIVTAAPCSEAAGNIYYAYTFPSASWQAGDYYLATMSGQEIAVNGITYPLSTVPFQGYVTREIGIVTDIAAVKADTAAILTDTGEIGVAGAGLTNINLPNQTMDIVGSITGNLSGSVGSVTGAVGSVAGNVGGNVVGSVASVTARVTANTDQIEGVDATDQIRDSILDDATRFSGADIDTAITTRATPAQVNAEVVDGLSVDTYAEPPQGAPAATTTIERKIAYMYKFARNEIRQTAAQLSVYNDAGAVVDQKAPTSDDGVTYTRGEVVSGP
jgi:hypothetical protein